MITKNWGKLLTILVLVIFLVIVIRGYVLQLQESNEDEEVRRNVYK